MALRHQLWLVLPLSPSHILKLRSAVNSGMYVNWGQSNAPNVHFVVVEVAVDPVLVGGIALEGPALRAEGRGPRVSIWMCGEWMHYSTQIVRIILARAESIGNNIRN